LVQVQPSFQVTGDVGIGVTVPYPHPKVVNLEKPMIITKAIVTYRCDHCGLDYMSSFTPIPPGDIAKINNSVDKTKQCAVCARHMKIEQIIFKTVKDSYGDDRYGSWCCPVHSAFIYYPSLMRKAERKQSVVDIRSDMAKRYEKVAAGGFPWICPGCGQSMIYRDDKAGSVCG